MVTVAGLSRLAGMDQVGIQKTTKSGLAWLTTGFVAMLAGGYALWTSGAATLKVMACGMWLISILLGAVMRQGGIIRDDDDIKRVQDVMQQKQRELEERQKPQQAQQVSAATAT